MAAGDVGGGMPARAAGRATRPGGQPALDLRQVEEELSPGARCGRPLRATRS